MPTTIQGIEILQTPAARPEAADANYGGLSPSVVDLPQGHKRHDNSARFLVDTIFERDIVIPLRDGVKLRADIFRPRQEKPVPAILAWSPYGKSGAGFYNNLDLVPSRAGVPQSRTSGYEKFEGLDPAEWTAKGYAICNIDARGTFDSEGDIRFFGTGEGKDGYDTIEYLASLPWCNGSVAMAGNSWLGISQWFIAAEAPPHLKCIAPLEGASDVYREIAVRGGVPNHAYTASIQKKLYGRQNQEDLLSMMTRYPLWNAYWEDKRAQMEKIKIPAYVLASYSTFLHTEGSFRGFEEIQGPKWLRVHPTQEWYDLYTKECNDDLHAFFDKYTKGIDNGWEKTPKVRISILRFDQPALENIVFPTWPIQNTSYQKLYLLAENDSKGALGVKTGSGSSIYRSDVPAMQCGNDAEELSFEYLFESPTYVVGYPRATLYASCSEHDDLDIFVQLRKMSRDGRLLENINIPADALGMPADKIPNLNILKYLGPTGIIRASHRELDVTLSKSHHPVLSHRKKDPVKPGEVVRLDVPIWVCGIAFEAGEKLVLKISGHDMRFVDFPPLSGAFRSGNKGMHKIYCGEEGYNSYLVLPTVDIHT